MAPALGLQITTHCLAAALTAAIVLRRRSGANSEQRSPGAKQSAEVLTDDVPRSSEHLHGQAIGGAQSSCRDEPSPFEMNEEQDDIPTFSDWASSELLGCQSNAGCPEDLRHGEIREALRTIAGLYLRADVPRIRDVIEDYHLADILTQYLIAHYKQSPTLAALGLQISQAFTTDANRQTRSAQSGATPPPSASPSNEGERPSMSAPGADVSGWVQAVASAPTNEVEALEAVAAVGVQSGAAREATAGTQQQGRISHSLDQSRNRPGSPPSVQQAHQDHGDAPAEQGDERRSITRSFSGAGNNRNVLDLHSLRSFGSRTILTYLMQELEALLTSYLSRNWHCMEDVLDANELDLREDGLICLPGAGGSYRENTLSAMSQTSSSTSLSTRTGNSALMSLDSADSDHSDMPASVAGPLRQLFSDVRSRSKAAKRARRNWQRAFQAYLKCHAVKVLRPKREFKTMTQLLHELCKPQAPRPADRDPIFLFLGGGMAAGKSTVREVIGSNTFWSQVGTEAVVIEADAIKNQDVVFQELQGTKAFAGDNSLSQFVHEYSTRRASGMLVAAVNAQKDIIFDGTCSWEPFVRQTVAMLRDHEHDYELGPGYQVREDGTVCESYWRRKAPSVHDEPISPRTPSRSSSSNDSTRTSPTKAGAVMHSLCHKRPYRVELVGVTCDPTLAVARGFWRKIRTGRAVPVSAQLRSHRMFAENWPAYCKMLDSATLYHTGADLTTINKEPTPPRVIAHKSRATRDELLVHPEAYSEFQQQAHLNEDAGAASELYPSGSVCTHKVLKCPKQLASRMSELRAALGFAHEERQRERERRRAHAKKRLTRKTAGASPGEHRHS